VASKGGRLRLVATTVVLTSLAWIGGLAVWLQGRAPAPAVSLPLAGAVGQAPAARAPATGAAMTSGSVTAPAGGLVLPVVGVARSQLVDTFTQSRANGGRRHDAIDIMAPRGTPVIAAAAGRVEKLFLSHDGGNTIYVRSPDGRLIYYYAHLDAYAPGLAEGQVVASGAPLGTVGSTGNANPDGPHLHFAIEQADPAGPWYQQAPAINPYPWLVSGQRPELGDLTQRSGAGEPSGATRRRNARPESE